MVKEDAVEQTRYVDTMKSEKQEQFAQLIAGGMSKAAAHREAYNAENMADERFGLKLQSWQITVRIAEIQKLSRQDKGIDLDYIRDEIVSCIGKLKDEGKHNHAAQRLMDLAKLLGLVTDKHELKGAVPTAPMPWEQMYAKDKNSAS